MIRRLVPVAPRLAVGLALCGLASCAALRRADEPARVVRGPIPSRIEHPLGLSFLELRPRRAAIEPAGAGTIAVESAYASIFEEASSGGKRVAFDGELWHTDVRARFGIADGADLEVELGALYASGGFLDPFIESWHELFGLGDGGRDDAEEDDYEMSVTSGGEEIFALEEDRVGLLDVPVVLTGRIHSDEAGGEHVAWRAGVELPLGSEDRGFGNGELDFGLGLLGETSFGRWTATGAVDAVFPSDPDAFDGSGVSIDDLFDLELGLECRWSDRLSWLFGVVLASPLTGDIDVEEIDAPMLDVGLGAAWDVGERSRLQLSFHEDVIAASGPDFTVFFGWTCGL